MSLSRKNGLKKAVAILLIVMVALITLMPRSTAAAESQITKDEAYTKVGEYLSGLAAEKGLAANNEWLVMGLARAGLLTDAQTEEYYESVEAYIDGIVNEKGQLKKSTDNSRIILALTAIGEDVTDVGGHNLLAGLSDLTYVNKAGINGSIYALLALDCHGYEIPAVAEDGTQATRENIIDAILEKQLEDGGFALFGTKSDSDVTAMAIQALAPYYNEDPEVKAAVDRALDRLSAMQADNGGYVEFTGKVNAPSSAQALVALAAMGIDPEADARFVKNGSSVVDALLSFYVEGGFGYTSNAKIETAPTQQGYYALVAYDRMLQGKTSLYDMSDVKIGGAEEPSDPVDPADPSNPAEPSNPEKPAGSGDVNNQETGTTPADSQPQTGTAIKTGDESNILPWIIAAVVALAAVVLVFIKKKKS